MGVALTAMFLFLRLLIVACFRFESIRRECIEHPIVLSERHLIKTLGEYFEYYNRSRPHQGAARAILTKCAYPRGSAPNDDRV